MAYAWKKMMLNLKVETTQKPAQQPVVRSEVDRGSELMGGPLIGQCALLIRGKKFRFVHHVGELEYNRKQKPQSSMHQQKTAQYMGGTEKLQWYQQIDDQIQAFTQPEFELITP